MLTSLTVSDWLHIRAFIRGKTHQQVLDLPHLGHFLAAIAKQRIWGDEKDIKDFRPRGQALDNTLVEEALKWAQP